MGRLFPVAVLPLFLLSTAVAPTPAQDNVSRVQAAIQAQYDRVGRSASALQPARLAAALNEIATPDYAYVSADGRRTNRDDSVGFLEGLVARTFACHQYRVRIQKVVMLGVNRARVTVHADCSWDESDSEENSHLRVLKGRGQDTWIHTSGGWKIEQSDELDSRVLMDGRLMRAASYLADRAIAGARDGAARKAPGQRRVPTTH